MFVKRQCRSALCGPVSVLSGADCLLQSYKNYCGSSKKIMKIMFKQGGRRGGAGCDGFPAMAGCRVRTAKRRGRGASFEIGTHLCRRGCELFGFFRDIPAPYLKARFIEWRRRVAVLHAGVAHKEIVHHFYHKLRRYAHQTRQFVHLGRLRHHGDGRQTEIQVEYYCQHHGREPSVGFYRPASIGR